MPTRPRRDEWHDRAVAGPQRVPRLRLPADDRRASPRPWPGPRIPGPTLKAEVGDTIVVHFRNGRTEAPTRRSPCTRTGSSTTRSTTASTSGTSRARAASSPRARSSPTRGSATPDAVGVWPYHDHGPNHTLNTFRGLFGAIVVRPKGGAKAPTSSTSSSCTACRRRSPASSASFQCINGRAYAGNTPTLSAQGRPGRRDPRHRHGLQLPHLPHPRPPLEGRQRDVCRHPRRGPERDDHRPLCRGQPGPLAVPLPRLHPPGRVGWRAGTWSSRKSSQEEPVRMSHHAHRRPRLVRRAASPPARPAAGHYPPPPTRTAQPRPEGPVPDPDGVQEEAGCHYRRSRRPSTRRTAGDTIHVAAAPTTRA